MSSAATIYLGLDVHNESVTIAVLPSGAFATSGSTGSPMI
jgi:hypothetical protein